MSTEFLTTITEKMKDEDFANALLANKTPEDAQKFLKSKGLDCSIEQVQELGKYLKEQLDTKELSPSQLEAVAGGGLFDYIKKIAEDVWDGITGWF